MTLIGRGQIIHDLGNVGIIDRGAIDLDHFGHFGLPEILLEFRSARLGVDVVSGVAGAAVVLHHVEIGPRFEGRSFLRQLVVDRSGGRRIKTKARDGGESEKGKTHHVHSPHAAVTLTVSTTLRKYPAGFHRGSIGWVSPALLVARTFN